MNAPEALVELRRMAAAIDQADLEAAASRLLERVSMREDSLELRAALAELGARVLVAPGRGRS